MLELGLIGAGKDWPLLYNFMKKTYWSEYARANLKLSEEDKDLLTDYNVYLGSQGYPQITVKGKSINVHQVIASRMGLPETGKGSNLEIDHINSDKFDARRENLRVLTCSDNNRKEKLLTSKGYCYDNFSKNYKVSIVFNGKHKHIGRFSTPEKARAAYVSAVKEMLGIEITD
jgi:hypothetical protein